MRKLTSLLLLLALLVTAACTRSPVAAREYTVQIVDAETGAPLAGATIDLHYYPSRPEQPNPGHPHAVADNDGMAMINSRAEPVIWEVQAADYITQQLSSNSGAPPPRYVVHACVECDAVVHLYALPEPQLRVIISDTYTGPLTINLEPAPGFDYAAVDEINVAFAATDPQASYVQDAPGMRVFTATASAEGGVDLVVTPLLYDITAQQLEIRDGTGSLPYRDIANPNDVGRGVWGSVSEDDKTLYHQIRLFVGTLEEYKAYLRSTGA